jgi:hypothetical protein
MNFLQLRVLLLAGLAASTVTPCAQAPVSVRLDPRHTYLRRNNDPAPEPAAFPLATLGIAPGQLVRLRRLGDFDNGPGGDTFGTTIAVFSNGETLLPATVQARVPGALEAGCDVATAATWFSSLPTDIPQDFLVAIGAGASSLQDDVVVEVPAAASHLFLCAHDSLYHDNTDPDADYGVEVTVLAPTPWTTLQGGVGGSGGEPTLGASGELACGSRVTLAIGNAPPFAPIVLVLGAARLDAPLFGGVLVPDPRIVEALGTTDAQGNGTLVLPVPIRFASGASLYAQVWLPDASAPFLLAATDAVHGVAR